MPKINQEEYEVLKELDDKWKWIARNYNGALITYTDKPMKNPNLYWDSFGERMDDRLFQFIQWEDESPYNIAELIEEYEYSAEHVSHVINERVKALGKAWSESEETEVKKDIEWLNNEVEKRIEKIKTGGMSFVGSDFFDEGYIHGMKYVQAIANQLDEPEVLSQKWIDENAQSFQWHESMVPASKLQNLLVLKKELPVIPKFVADWIEEVKPDNSLRVAFEYIAQQKRDNHDDELAFWVEEGNSETFARAWLDGYTVEEEQKYYVLDKEGHLLIRGFSNGSVGRVGERMKPDIYPDWNKKNLPLTEQEIKDYDERFWPFAVKVEELNEHD